VADCDTSSQRSPALAHRRIVPRQTQAKSLIDSNPVQQAGIVALAVDNPDKTDGVKNADTRDTVTLPPTPTTDLAPIPTA